MRKYLLATLLLILFVCWMGPAQQLLSRYLLQDEPTFHEIQDGEWLSRIALRYYGDVSYWRELELINRAPDGDRIFPGEEIIIPSFDVLREIRKTQRLSKVNSLIHEQQSILAGRTRERAPERARLESEIAEDIKAEVIESFEQPVPALDAPGPAGASVALPAENGPELSEPVTGDDSDLPLAVTAFDDDLVQENATLSAAFLGGVALLIAILVVGVVVYLRRQKQEEIAVYGDTEEQDSIRPGIFLDSESSESDEDDDISEDEQARNGATRERELA